MTLEEAKLEAKKLGELTLAIWNSSSSIETAKLRAQFHEVWHNINDNGFKVLKRRTADPSTGRTIPVFKIRNDHSEQMVTIVNNRPDSGNHHGDCTTRCICLCTGEDYMTIQNEQMTNARKMSKLTWKLTWRSESVWSKSLTSRGFSKIMLPRKVARKTFLKLFANCGLNDGIIATKSSGHVAAIDMKAMKVLDTWNSTGGRIISIFVPSTQKDIWQKKVAAILG